MWFAPLRRFGSSPAFTPAPTPSRLRSVPGSCSAINHHPPTSLTPAPVTSALVHPMVHALHGVCVCEGCSVRHLCYRRSCPAPSLSTVQEFLARLASGACRCMHASLPTHLQCCRGSSVPDHDLSRLSRPVLPSPPSPLVRLYGSRGFLSSAGVVGWPRGPRAHSPLQACELASRSAYRLTTP